VDLSEHAWRRHTEEVLFSDLYVCAVISACGKERHEIYMAIKAKIVEDVD